MDDWGGDGGVEVFQEMEDELLLFFEFSREGLVRTFLVKEVFNDTFIIIWLFMLINKTKNTI